MPARLESVGQIQRGISRDQNIRVVVADTTEIVAEACSRHGLAGGESVVLGRALTSGALLATLTKNEDERVRIDLRGGGPVGTILIDCRGNGAMRGCLQAADGAPTPVQAPGRPSVASLVGTQGQVVVTRDLGLENPYQGLVPMTSGEVDEDVEAYLTRSEQLPSALGCAVVLDANQDVLRSAGVLCQTFPGGDPAPLDRVREMLKSGALHDLLLQERSLDELMGFALMGEPFNASAPSALEFQCSCSYERALSVLSALGHEEIESLAAEDGDTEVRCSFCGARYVVPPLDLVALAARLRMAGS